MRIAGHKRDTREVEEQQYVSDVLYAWAQIWWMMTKRQRDVVAEYVRQGFSVPRTAKSMKMSRQRVYFLVKRVYLELKDRPGWESQS